MCEHRSWINRQGKWECVHCRVVMTQGEMVIWQELKNFLSAYWAANKMDESVAIDNTITKP